MEEKKLLHPVKLFCTTFRSNQGLPITVTTERNLLGNKGNISASTLIVHNECT